MLTPRQTPCIEVERTMCFVVQRVGTGDRCDRPAMTKTSFGKPVCWECAVEGARIEGLIEALGKCLGVVP